VTVASGATLTIQPGVIVKGQAGTGANATALIIARGAKLMAEEQQHLQLFLHQQLTKLHQDKLQVQIWIQI
jgi:hypothetical protein